METKLAKLEKRFKEKIDVNGPILKNMDTKCWVWTGYRNEKGYAITYKNGKNRKAHRIIHEIINNVIIPDDMLLLHHCDGGSIGCVNPDHTYIGTEEDNIKDMIERDRFVKGADVINAKINDEIALDIRLSFDSGESRDSISKRHNISKDLVNQVISGESWKHVGGPIVERTPRAKITKEMAKDILMRDANGEMQKDIAADYRIDRSHVSKIVSGKKGRYIDPEYRKKCAKIKQDRLSQITNK